jgi:hypothetical protein
LRRCAERLAERRATEDFLDGFGSIGHHRGLLLIFNKTSGFHFSGCGRDRARAGPLSIAKKG